MDWYLIEDGAASGSRNMAKDERLLERALDWSRPVLRLYEWSRPTLSLGCNQRVAGLLDSEACSRAGLDFVRRMTGGWAVLHGADLTYSISAPLATGEFGATIHSTYMAIAEVFLALFRELGYAPTLQSHSARERAELASPICFATPSTCELLIDGKKLIGSAQRRRAEAFLQHGSIPLRDQRALLASLFRGAAGRDVEGTMTDLESIGLWARIEPEAFRARLLSAFERVAGARFSAAPWSGEDESATATIELRYAAVPPPWTDTGAPAADGAPRAAIKPPPTTVSRPGS